MSRALWLIGNSFGCLTSVLRNSTAKLYPGPLFICEEKCRKSYFSCKFTIFSCLLKPPFLFQGFCLRCLFFFFLYITFVCIFIILCAFLADVFFWLLMRSLEELLSAVGVVNPPPPLWHLSSFDSFVYYVKIAFKFTQVSWRTM